MKQWGRVGYSSSSAAGLPLPLPLPPLAAGLPAGLAAAGLAAGLAAAGLAPAPLAMVLVEVVVVVVVAVVVVVVAVAVAVREAVTEDEGRPPSVLYCSGAAIAKFAHDWCNACGQNQGPSGQRRMSQSIRLCLLPWPLSSLDASGVGRNKTGMLNRVYRTALLREKHGQRGRAQGGSRSGVRLRHCALSLVQSLL